MIRTLKFFFLLAILLGFILAFLNIQGIIKIETQAYLIETNVSAVLIGIVAVYILTYFLMRIYSMTKSIPGRIRRYYKLKNLESSLDHVRDFFHEFEAENWKSALKSASYFEKYSQRETFSTYLRLLVHHKRGEMKDYVVKLKTLEVQEDYAFIAQNRLAQLEQKNGDLKQALQHAEAAHQLEPTSKAATLQLLNLSVTFKDYVKAEQYLKDLKSIDPNMDEYVTEGLSILTFLKAKDLKGSKQIDALKAVIKRKPDLIEAVVLLAKDYINAKNFSKAKELIEKTWEVAPSEELVPFYLSTFEDPTAIDAVQKAKHIQRLVSFNGTAPTSLLIGARTYLEAQLYGQARAYLDKIESAQRSKGYYQLLAQIEIQENNDHAKAEALYQDMANAPTPPAYRCEICHSPYEKWQSICTTCHQFARIK